jgi:hypothetical protein
VETSITEYRDDGSTGLNESLSGEGRIATALGNVAREHANRSAAAGGVIDPPNDIYSNKLLDNCRVFDNQRTSLLRGPELVAITTVPAAGLDDTELIDAVREGLIFDSDTRAVLRLEAADYLRVGIAFTPTDAYVTVAVC